MRKRERLGDQRAARAARARTCNEHVLQMLLPVLGTDAHVFLEGDLVDKIGLNTVVLASCKPLEQVLQAVQLVTAWIRLLEGAPLVRDEYDLTEVRCIHFNELSRRQHVLVRHEAGELEKGFHSAHVHRVTVVEKRGQDSHSLTELDSSSAGGALTIP